MTLTQEKIVVPLGNRKRIELQLVEIDLLKELCIHRIMQAKEIHYFYLNVSMVPKHHDSITRRLRKMVSAGILLRMQENVSHTGAKVIKTYYKLGRKGLNVLVQIGFLTMEKAEQLSSQILPLKIPKPHNRAASSIANQVRVNWIQDIFRVFLEFHHYRGSEDEVLKNRSDSGIVIPDWVFTVERNKVFLEVDSGTQTLKVIDSKMKRYIKVAKELEEDVMVVFSVMDESVHPEQLADRSKRIASLKENMPPCQHWPDNLSVYVITAERTTDLIIRLLCKGETSDKEYREYAVDEWLEDWKDKVSNEYKITNLERKKVYPASYIETLEADRIIHLKGTGSNKIIALLYAEEGSVRTYQLIRANHHRTNDVRGIKCLDELIVIYSESDFRNNDVFHMFWDKAWFTYLDSIKDEEYPIMHKPVNYTRRKPMTFE